MRAIFALLVLLLAPPPGRADPPGLEVTVTGPPTLVFAQRRDGCGPWDTPDAPARAVRRADGEVLLFGLHWDNRALRGPDLLRLRPDCVSRFRGAEHPDPARFSDRGWITALWTEDGTTIHAIVHNEHQGHRHHAHPVHGACPTRRYRDCWMNSLTGAVSEDGGDSFRPAGAPPHLVAALPETASALLGRPAGLFNPSGIVRHQGRLHMFALLSGSPSQPRGNCLLATADIADPGAWRGFDGQGFGARLGGPGASHGLPCAPVGQGRLQWPVTGLVRHAPSGLFLAVMLGGPHRPDRQEPAPGVYVATSPDLLRWSRPARILPGIGHAHFTCGGEAPIAYPSILDPDSASPAFETVGARAELFVTRFEVPDCRINADRSLLRWPLAIAPAP